MKLNSRKQRTSPLKDKPLRNPGQSIDEELQRLWDLGSRGFEGKHR